MGNSWDAVVGTQPYEEALSRAQEIAEENGYLINPDQERAQKVIGLMTMNHTEFGKCYCPCKQSHPLDPKKDVICPCPEMSDEAEKGGSCFCKLFFKKE